MVGSREYRVHHVQLHRASQAIDQASAAKRLRIVKHDSDMRASLSKNAKNAKKTAWKTARRPGQSRVLHKDPRPTPGFGLEPQRSKRRGPAMFFPGNTPNLQIKTVRGERFAKIAAIVFHSVSRFVAAAEQSDDELWFHRLGTKTESFAVSVSRAASRGKTGEKQQATQKVIG
jgi:hypothetical protein